MRPRRLVLCMVVVAAAGAAATVIVRTRDVGEASSTTTDAPPKLSYAKVDKRDLTRSEDFDGRVGHGAQNPLRLTGNGMLTALPSVGEVIDFGHQLAEVDGEPVLLLQGDRP